MQAASPFETSANVHQRTMHQISEDWGLHQHHCENPKTQMQSSCTIYLTIAQSNGTRIQNMCTNLTL